TETAASVTPSSAAAAFTEPKRATSTNDCSWARVIRPLSPSGGDLSKRLTHLARVESTDHNPRSGLEEADASPCTIRLRASDGRRARTAAARAAGGGRAHPRRRLLAAADDETATRHPEIPHRHR